MSSTGIAVFSARLRPAAFCAALRASLSTSFSTSRVTSLPAASRAAFCALLSLLLIGGCASLPSQDNRPQSTALPASAATPLAQRIMPATAAHPGKSGLFPLADARDAFAARAQIVNAAQNTLDVQYYIWRNDMTGKLLFDTLRNAAARGVRVRLLLDDNNTAGLDTLLADFDHDPNIEVRLFNPFAVRSPRWLGYVTDFSRANRRMHNKSLTADNLVTIIGGRNVGDEYFGATDGVLFSDLDVLAIGPVVGEVSTDFDRYWASASSYPVTGLLPASTPKSRAETAAVLKQTLEQPASTGYTDAIRDSPFVRKLVAGELTLEWAATRLVSDDPAKGLGKARDDSSLPDQFRKIIGEPSSNVDLVSPYFVLTDESLAAFESMARRGVKLRVLTNSLEATDVAAVHAGYMKSRKQLLAAGVKLYELRKVSAEPAEPRSRFGFGSSASSLHAKTFAVDDSTVFIGSFNFDPRSADLNTEIGFVIDSPVMARQIGGALAERLPAGAYEVLLSETGELYWIERDGARTIRYDAEPGTKAWQRAGVWLISLLPIDSLL
jgi:putative cardiolipin synthase